MGAVPAWGPYNRFHITKLSLKNMKCNGKKISQKAWFCSYWTSILKWWKVIVSHKFTLWVSLALNWFVFFLLFLSFFPVVSLPHSVFKGCAGASGSSPKHELRAGCHHLGSFSVHLCWGTIHQANGLEESTVAKLPIWNKSALNETSFSFPFFSASLLNQSLPSICMALEEVGFSAVIFCAEEAGSSSENCKIWLCSSLGRRCLVTQSSLC